MKLTEKYKECNWKGKKGLKQPEHVETMLKVVFQKDSLEANLDLSNEFFSRKFEYKK